MEDTGERLLTIYFGGVPLEHLHRYSIAQQYIKGKKVLDIASGEGYGSMLLANEAESVIGVDVSQEAVEHSKGKYQRKNLEYKVGAFEKIPCDDKTFDVVVSFETIEHTDKHQEGLKEIQRVLKKDGILIMSSPNKLNYSDIPQYKNPFHVKELYIEDFKKLIAQYFPFSAFFQQKTLFCSLVVPQNSPDSFCEFSGNFDSLKAFSQFQNPIYDICIASNNPIATYTASIFECKEVSESLGKQHYLNEGFEKGFKQGLNEGITKVQNSFSYKLGNALLTPFSCLKKIFR